MRGQKGIAEVRSQIAEVKPAEASGTCGFPRDYFFNLTSYF
jgi:hypothetical protein